jgi:polysaccharide pyruvyl transferase WcaK-like protein
MKINFIGWYGQNNIGDDCFQLVFSESFHGHDLVFTQKPDLSCDAFIWGGGGVIDYGYFEGIDSILDKPLYAVGVDIPLSGEKYSLIQYPFKKILVRSKEYFWLAREQGMKNVSYIPDLAFWVHPPEKKESTKPRIGVSLMRHLLQDEIHLQDHIGKVLCRKQNLADILFLVFKGNDLQIIESVMSRWDIKGSIITPATPTEMIETISTLDTILTVRFHGAVFANLCRVPFISLSVPGKHSLFCEQEELNDSFLDIRDLNEYKLLARMNKMLSSESRGNPYQNHLNVRGELHKIRLEIEELAA